MRILHIIFQTDVINTVFDYWQDLLNCMQYDAHLHVIAPSSLETTLSGVSHFYPFDSNINILNKRYIQNVFSKVQPAIIHICGSVSYNTYYVVQLAHHLHIPIIYSLGCSAMPWHHETLKTKRYFAYMLKHVSVFHAITAQEYSFLVDKKNKMGISNLSSNPIHVELIESFNRKADISILKMKNIFVALYEKVANTLPFVMMNVDWLHIEDIFLKVGLNADYQLTENERQTLVSLYSSDKEYLHYLLLHAYDENIIDKIKCGANRLHIQLPQLNIENVCRYKKTVIDNSLEEKKLAYICKQLQLADNEKQVFGVFYKVYYRYKNNTLRRSDLVRLYEVLTSIDFDEYAIRMALEKTKIDTFMTSLFDILEKRMGLSEGYMILQPHSTKMVRNIAKKLYNLTIQ